MNIIIPPTRLDLFLEYLHREFSDHRRLDHFLFCEECGGWTGSLVLLWRRADRHAYFWKWLNKGTPAERWARLTNLTRQCSWADPKFMDAVGNKAVVAAGEEP